MRAPDPLPSGVLCRKAIVYVRQSTPTQVRGNLESQRRQYDLLETAKSYGFSEIQVIDEDLGRSASGCAERPGFERVVAELCAGAVGAVLCLEASRLARNGRDWHHLLELCGLVEARVIDLDGAYDPRNPNDRLLLGMKGTISEFELGILRTRLIEAARAKARRGELRLPVPTGFIWDREGGIRLDDDLRLQEVIRLIFRKFEELGSARQVHLWMHSQDATFPRPSGGKHGITFTWTPVRYRNVISVLKNPFYAGAYAYGKSAVQTEIVAGRARKRYGRAKPLDQWDVLLPQHHEGYISWEQFGRNQTQLARNAYGTRGGKKSGRGGRALLSGLLVCARCGLRLSVVYTGKSHDPKYRCDKRNRQHGLPRCFSFGAWRPDKIVSDAVLHAVEPAALDAAWEAEKMREDQAAERRRATELELEQARYEASLAERRYAACDPDNRLIAAQLEKAWEGALQRLRLCEEKLMTACQSEPSTADPDDLGALASDLKAVWESPATSMRARQRLVRSLVEDIIADVDEEVGDIVLTIRWRGGLHTELRTKKPKSGEHRRRASDEAVAVIRSMAGKWSDEHIAANLNRLGYRTGADKSWTGGRVQSLRANHDIRAYRPADGDGDWLTMSQAAAALGVTNHVIRRLIRDGVLPAEQVVPRAPYQIRTVDVSGEAVREAMMRRGRPCRPEDEATMPNLPGFE